MIKTGEVPVDAWEGAVVAVAVVAEGGTVAWGETSSVGGGGGGVLSGGD